MSPGIINRQQGQCTDTPYGGHATSVAGVIGSVYPGYDGVAHKATLLGGEGSVIEEDNLTHLMTCTKKSAYSIATSWAYTEGARVMNNSWTCGDCTAGVISEIGRYHDSIVRAWNTTIVNAAGNGEFNFFVADPAIAYNVIAVGAFDDKNTASLTDDEMAYSFSSYKNPFSSHGDREKPDVVAPGVNIVNTTFSYPWMLPEPGISGTSIAAPHVTGGAALLMQRQPALKSLPMAVKAILMATARDIDGAEPVTWSIDTYDGAGAIRLDKADFVARKISNRAVYHTKHVYRTDFNSYGNLVYFFNATEGQKITAVITWDTSIYAVTGYPDEPSVDLDLSVYNPGQNYAWVVSMQYDNNWEIAKFEAPYSGEYKVKVHNARFNDSATNFAIVWYVE